MNLLLCAFELNWATGVTSHLRWIEESIVAVPADGPSAVAGPFWRLD